MFDERPQIGIYGLWSRVFLSQLVNPDSKLVVDIYRDILLRTKYVLLRTKFRTLHNEDALFYPLLTL